MISTKCALKKLIKQKIANNTFLMHKNNSNAINVQKLFIETKSINAKIKDKEIIQSIVLLKNILILLLKKEFIAQNVKLVIIRLLCFMMMEAKKINVIKDLIFAKFRMKKQKNALNVFQIIFFLKVDKAVFGIVKN